MTWRAGAATVALPLPSGIALGGYGSRTAASSGTLDALEANVLALADGAQISLLVSLDLLAIDAAWVRALRSRVWAEHRVPAELVLVAASHTHAGPAGFRRVGATQPFDQGTRRLRRRLLDMVTSLVSTTLGRLVPAKVRVGSAISTVAAHRTDQAKSSDQQLTRLDVVADDDDALISVVWHYACHATVLAAENLSVSADLPGAVRSELRQRHGDMVPVVYLNGAAADVSTRFTRLSQSVDEMRRLARLVADAMPVATLPLPSTPPAGRITSCALPCAVDEPTAVAARLASARKRYEDAEWSIEPARLRVLETDVLGLEKRLRRSHAMVGGSEAPVNAEVQLIDLGDLALVGVPGELYAEQGLRIRDCGGSRRVLPVGYAGGYVGYLPPREGAEGYEADSAVVAAGAGDRVVDRARDMLSQVGRS